VEEVFDFLRGIESRMRLSPAYRVEKFEKLTPGAVGKRTRFRVQLASASQAHEYVSEVVEFVENKRIVTRGSRGRLQLTLRLKRRPWECVLVHEEQYELPDLSPPAEEKGAPSFFRDMIEGLKELGKIAFGTAEELRRIEQLKMDLAENLQIWLRRIKETLEARHVHR